MFDVQILIEFGRLVVRQSGHVLPPQEVGNAGFGRVRRAEIDDSLSGRSGREKVPISS